MFDEKSISNILIEGRFEFMKQEEMVSILRMLYRYLSYGSTIRIAMTDGFHTNPEYIEKVRPRMVSKNNMGYKQLLNYNTLFNILDSCGFKVRFYEFFDDTKYFNKYSMDSERGYVQNSYFNNHENTDYFISNTHIKYFSKKESSYTEKPNV
jgi:predicted SAM-dependent methyltransferase